MMAEQTTPGIRPFDGSAIPEVLKAQPRWAPWVAVFNEKRNKFDKIPHRADVPEHRLSTANPDRWFTYKAALGTYQREHPSFAGVGYVMTRPHGVVGIDLDNCLHDGVVDAWAAEVVRDLASYAEISPSGKGLRVFCLGEAADWTNHTVGVEVYGGAEPRFLTLTGTHLVGSPLEVRKAPAGALEALRARYGREASKVDVPLEDLPELLDELMLPSLEQLDLPYAARDFLLSGDCRGDRSRELHAAAVALYQCGLPDDEVFSLLAASPHAMEVALDHRRQDSDRALMYLWKEHCLKARGKGGRKVATAEDFDALEPGEAPAPKPSDAIEVVAKKPLRFAIEQAAVFSRAAPLRYFIKGVLPQAEICAVFGESGSGKTFFALDLLMAVATGRPWRGRRVRQGAVLYVCAEGSGGFRSRLRAYADYHGVDLDQMPFFVLGDAPNLLERGDVRDLLSAIRALPVVPALICFDTWAQVTAGGNENSGEDMGRALGHCKALHRALAATVLIVGHSGKDADRGMRGWSGVKGALDAEIVVERSDDYRAATVTKLKDGVGEGEEYPFALESIGVGQDEDGDEVTSCVVHAVASAPGARRRTPLRGKWQLLALRVAQTLTDLADVVTTDELLDAVVNEMPLDGGDKKHRRGRAFDALESLIAGGHLSTAGGKVVLL